MSRDATKNIFRGAHLKEEEKKKTSAEHKCAHFLNPLLIVIFWGWGAAGPKKYVRSSNFIWSTVQYFFI